MQFTFEYGELDHPPAEDLSVLGEVMVRYCTAKRTAHQSLRDVNKLSEVIHLLEDSPFLHLNWRYCEHAARDAKADISGKDALRQLYLAETRTKIKEAERLREKGRSRRLERRLTKLKKKEQALTTRTEKTVFGTRKLLTTLAEGKSTNAEWKAARNNQIYSIGQANQKGNANIRIDGDRIGVNISEKTEPRIGRDGRTYRVRNRRMWLPLRVNEKYRELIGRLLASGMAYSVRIVRKDGRVRVQVSFQINMPSLDHAPEIVCSVDSNPAGPAATLVGQDGNLIDHKFFRDPRLIYAAEDKREQITGEIVGRMMKWALGHGAEAFVVERLSIKGGGNFGRSNRVIYAFVRRKFAETIRMQCWKHNVPLVEVNPAYTSKIGKAKYLKRLGLAVHEAAAFCIGRRFYGYGERLSEPMLITVKNGVEKVKVPVMYVWASIYGHGRSADPRMEPPRRKGSLDWKPNLQDGAVFTGRPADESPPLSVCGDMVRKGGEHGGNPWATGNGVKPAPQQCGGEAAATSLGIRNSDT